MEINENESPAFFQVSIDSTTSPVEGDPLEVTARIENTGDQSDTQTVALDVPGLGSDSTNVSLEGGRSTTETLSVGTESGDNGTYTATVSTDDDEASTGVTVEEPTPPSEIADVPAALDEVLLRALATEKAERYEAVLLLRNDLQELRESL